MNYRALLDELSSDTPNPNPWAAVKIIDFAHAFFYDDDDDANVDENFKQGIDSFVEIFEGFLKETDSQVAWRANSNCEFGLFAQSVIKSLV